MMLGPKLEAASTPRRACSEDVGAERVSMQDVDTPGFK
jgi:hypothetical protein